LALTSKRGSNPQDIQKQNRPITVLMSREVITSITETCNS